MAVMPDLICRVKVVKEKKEILMANPLDVIKDKVEEIKADVALHVKIWFLRLVRDLAITKLVEIDPDPQEVALQRDVQAILKG